MAKIDEHEKQAEDDRKRQKSAVTAMRNAQSNMSQVLERVKTLESALAAAAFSIRKAKGYVGSDSHIYNSTQSVSAYLSESEAKIMVVLSA